MTIDKMTFVNSEKDSIDIVRGDIIRIDANGQSVFISGHSLIETLMESSEWNTLVTDTITGVKQTISNIINNTHP